MIDRVVSLPLERATLEIVADPLRLHEFVMQSLPDLGGRSAAIRADTGTQFRVDLPMDPLGAPGGVALRLRGESVSAPGARSIVLPEPHDGMRVTAVVAAGKRTTHERHTRIRPVTDPEAHTWAGELLGRHGLEPSQLAVSGSRRFGRFHPPPASRRREPTGKAGAGDQERDIPAFVIRDLTATVTITDPELCRRAFHLGIGRGRAYGLGMLVPLPDPATFEEPSA